MTFPKGAELIADPNVKMYQCKFTYLKDKKLDTSKTKLSELTFADTDRTFACEVPAWGEKGKMPEEAYFTTNLQVLENGNSRSNSKSRRSRAAHELRTRGVPRNPDLPFAPLCVRVCMRACMRACVCVCVCVCFAVLRPR